MAGDYLVDRSVATIVGAIGMVLLFICWKSRSGKFETFAPIGWLMTGFYFFNDVTFYIEHNDPVLSTMSALTLPGAVGIALWGEEFRNKNTKMRYFGLGVRLQ